MANRLAEATSPYLLQHADNPVDWREWDAAAFDEARRRDVPVLISVGYAACHWCHVMAHESFEDPAVAAVVNEHTVPVKVDREERPDVDAVYMTATQAMTGQGGWPMTVFATPDGAPFWCGTYLPKAQFTALVKAVAEAWRERRDEVVGQGDAVVSALRRAAAPTGPGEALTPELLDAAAVALRSDFDRANGGFGTAPKFPPSMVLEFLLRQHARTGDPQSLAMVRETCARMARGGMYDQLAGGFARYAVDATWTVPHFEKMLYDNALLLRVYTHLWRATGDPLARRVARETVEFLLTDLRAGDGFAASLDADTDGAEGLTYVWTPAQLREVLGDEDGDWATDLLDVTGTFERGTSVLQLPVDPADRQRWVRVRARLRAARDVRPQPARDDKVVTAWNGLAITALAEFAMISMALDRPAGGDEPPSGDERTSADELPAAAA
ncbi:MAG: thioredoxin domain-containing protein, partial [Actinocatenispora sp.]